MNGGKSQEPGFNVVVSLKKKTTETLTASSFWLTKLYTKCGVILGRCVVMATTVV